MSQSLLFPDPKPLVERLGKGFFRKIPRQTGVYKMRDASDKIVYVGKAKNLRQRLRSYRIASPERLPRRHLRMLREVTRIEFELCPGEAAALKQEAKLIRALKPKFNRAGVWPGKTRFLAWRFEPHSVEFAIPETPPAGWGRIGPLGSWAPRLQAALVRLLWLSVNPEKDFGELPRGWANGELGEVAKICLGTRLAELPTMLETKLCLQPEAFVLWLSAVLPAEISGFNRAAMQADCEIILEFAALQTRRKNDAGQMPLL